MKQLGDNGGWRVVNSFDKLGFAAEDVRQGAKYARLAVLGFGDVMQRLALGCAAAACDGCLVCEPEEGE